MDFLSLAWSSQDFAMTPKRTERLTGRLLVMIALRSVIAYNRPMRTTSYSDLRRNLAATLDSVSADHEPVVITRTGASLPPC